MTVNKQKLPVKYLLTLLALLSLLLVVTEAYAELTNGQAADVVIGQIDFTSNGINQGREAGNPLAKTLYNLTGV